MQYLKQIIEKQVQAQITDDIPLKEIVCRTLNKVVRKYYLEYELANDVFVRLPPSTLDKISLALENIVIKLPNDFFEIRTQNDANYNEFDPGQGAKEPFPFFYIPLQETLPQFDQISKRKDDQFSLLYIKPNETKNKKDAVYPLEAMFECYKASIPHYDYHEFCTIVQNAICSDNSDDQLMEYFIETFGCEAIEFLTEIVQHRNKSIDFGLAFEGKRLLCSNNLTKRTRFR